MVVKRRSLLAFFAAAPAIIAIDRLMPVRTPRLILAATHPPFEHHIHREYNIEWDAMDVTIEVNTSEGRYSKFWRVENKPDAVAKAEAMMIHQARETSLLPRYVVRA